METKIYTITDPEKDHDKIAEAAEILRNGGLVAFPTDTVYAVGAIVNDEAAVDKLFEAKQRPKDNPISVLVARDLDIHLVIDITAPNNQFMSRFVEAFWPGPLTIIMPRIRGRIPANVAGGGMNVGVRMPDNPIALALIDEAGAPLAAPSANISGHPSPTTGQHVIDDLNGRVDMILVGPDCDSGIESTIVDLSQDQIFVIRPGVITRDQLQEVIPRRIYEVPSDSSR